jgi:protoheme IX farnesyltransferase
LSNTQFYIQLMKFRLSATVVFSALIGYLLGTAAAKLDEVALLLLAGILVTGSANAFNQIVEREYDKLMKRTATRPLPTGNLSITNAIVFASAIGILGLYILQMINMQCSFFGLLSILLYVLVYTPIKRKSPISIFIGAFPGAIPILLGWVAATDDFGLAAGILFAIQFCWQFPHFIAISWVLDEEYKKAGFKMMIAGEKGKVPALIAIISTLLMTLVSVIPFLLQIEQLQLSVYGAIVILVLGLLFTGKSFQLLQKQTEVAARKVLVNSYLYLPLMQLIYVLDKYLMQ